MNQETINMIAGIAFSVFGWFARVLWVAVRDLEKDLAKLREDLPQTYLPKHEARDMISDLTKEIRDNFNHIFTLLDNKADKS